MSRVPAHLSSSTPQPQDFGQVEATVHRYCRGPALSIFRDLRRNSVFCGHTHCTSSAPGPVAFRLRTEAVEEFHTSPTCCSRRLHLDSGLFLRVCIWQAFPVVFLRQSTLPLEVFHTLSTSCLRPRSSHVEIWTLLSRPFRWPALFAQCLARQWIHVYVQLGRWDLDVFPAFFP